MHPNRVLRGSIGVNACPRERSPSGGGGAALFGRLRLMFLVFAVYLGCPAVFPRWWSVWVSIPFVRVLWRLYLLFRYFCWSEPSDDSFLRRTGLEARPLVPCEQAFVPGKCSSVSRKCLPDQRLDRLVTVKYPSVPCLHSYVLGKPSSVPGKFRPDQRVDRLVTAKYPIVSCVAAFVPGKCLSVSCVDGYVSRSCLPALRMVWWGSVPLWFLFSLFPRGPPGY